MKSALMLLNDNKLMVENDLTDPAHFQPLILRQKRNVKTYPNDPKNWVKLGCLYEERARMTSNIVRSSLFLRYVCTPLFPVVFIFVQIFYFSGQHNLFTANPLFYSLSMLFLLLIFLGMFLLRNPRSGNRFFKKAIAIDRNCGEAYMHLGFIALRRRQKRTACNFFEHALKLKVDDKKLKRELKTLYENEFIKFFNTQKKEDNKKQKSIDNLQEQIKKLQAENHLHQTNIAILKSKTRQTVSSAKQNFRLKSREMNNQILDLKKNYQEKIAEIEKEKIDLAEEKKIDPIIYVNLTDDLFQSKLKMEQLSFHQTSETIKNAFELDLWQSLSRQTKYYLVTAEQTFTIFSKSDEIKDFGLIGLEYCKALELEISKKFIIPFIEYIKKDKEEFLKLNQTGERKNKPKYLSYLSMLIDEQNYPDINSLTLGQFHFSLTQSLKNGYGHREYREFITGLFSNSQKGIPLVFSKKLGIVVKRYRNVIAHQSSMNMKECEHLRELVFLGKDSLLSICASR